jgi:serine/threonine protein kinase
LSVNSIGVSGVWQLVDQEKIHNQCLSKDPEERISALDQIRDSLSSIPDKQQAWNDLIKLTDDENSDVRTSSNHSLGSVSIFKASQAETDEN